MLNCSSIVWNLYFFHVAFWMLFWIRMAYRPTFFILRGKCFKNSNCIGAPLWKILCIGPAKYWLLYPSAIKSLVFKISWGMYWPFSKTLCICFVVSSEK